MLEKVVKMSILKCMAQLFPGKLRKKFYVHESKQNPHRINSIEENDKLGSSRRVSAPQSASSQVNHIDHTFWMSDISLITTSSSISPIKVR